MAVLLSLQKKEIHKVLCGKNLCGFCLELHTDECKECEKKYEENKVKSIMSEQKICEDCGKETEVLTVCPDCWMKLCKFCLDIHKEDHIMDEYEEDEEEDNEYDKRPPKNKWS